MCLAKVKDLNRELKEMRALVEELHSALRAEQTEKSNLQVKAVFKGVGSGKVTITPALFGPP